MKKSATLALLIAFSVTTGWAGKGSKGKPGGGGDGEDPPPPPPPPPSSATVEYELTWLAGFGGGESEVYDVNANGIAVGRSTDTDGTWIAFWATPSDGMTPLGGWWQLPPGYEDWWMASGSGGKYQINEANQVAGSIFHQNADGELEGELFLADLLDPDSLQPLGPIPTNSNGLQLNENGDIAFMGTTADGWIPHLYVGSLGQIYEYPSLAGYGLTGLNDHLQMTMLLRTRVEERRTSYDIKTGSARLTVDPVTAVGSLEDLGSATDYRSEAVTFAWAINNAGTAFGGFEDEPPVSSRKNRIGNARAGSIGAATWNELDPALPSGSSKRSDGYEGIVMAACAMDVNEAGQVLGAYDHVGDFSGTGLWLQDAVDGVFDIDDLLVGDSTAIQAFRASDRFWDVAISEPADPGVGYGFITGSIYESSSSRRAFILTPKPISAP